MVKSIKINDLVFPVDYSLTKEELDIKYPEDDENATTLGVYDPDLHIIFIAKDMGPERRVKVLVHECIEAINDSAELGLEDNHAKVVALENSIISFILNNKGLIEEVWKKLGKKGRT